MWPLTYVLSKNPIIVTNDCAIHEFTREEEHFIELSLTPFVASLVLWRTGDADVAGSRSWVSKRSFRQHTECLKKSCGSCIEILTWTGKRVIMRFSWIYTAFVRAHVAFSSCGLRCSSKITQFNARLKHDRTGALKSKYGWKPRHCP